MRYFNRRGTAAGYRAEGNVLCIYDIIGEDFWGYGVPAQAVRDFLDSAGGEAVTIRVNSPGGYVTEGVAMHTALAEYEGEITVRVDGIAASAASFLIMPANEIIMAQGTFLMIHQAHTIALGTADDMRKEAEILDKMDGQIAGIYAGRAESDVEGFLDQMRAETWFTPDEAVEAGLADSIQGDSAVTAAFDLSVYQNAPEDLKRLFDSLEQPVPEPDPFRPSTPISMRKRRLELAQQPVG